MMNSKLYKIVARYGYAAIVIHMSHCVDNMTDECYLRLQNHQ